MLALLRRSPGLRVATEWPPRMMVPRRDLGVLGFRFWCISPTAGLIVLVSETPG